MPFLLSASNIGWPKEYDEAVYAALQAAGFAGVEIAPTRIFPAPPYDYLSAAVLFGGYLHQKFGLAVPSMQSIWYGQTGNIFVPEEAEALLAYTEEAFAFAHAPHCPSLVFGCPKNRRRPEGADPAAAEAFFDKAGRLAMRYGVRLALEANSPRYTNYLNTTAEVFALVKKLGNPGLAVNLDLGAILDNGERLRDFAADLSWVSHVHISEPQLKPIERRQIHDDLKDILLGEGYDRFISVEMGKTGNMNDVRKAVRYVREICDEKYN